MNLNDNQKEKKGFWEAFWELPVSFKNLLQLLNIRAAKNWKPKAYQVETKNAYLIIINLPNVDKKSIKVESDSEYISVTGARKKNIGPEKTGSKKTKYNDNGVFSLEFDIMENIDSTKIEASFSGALLLIRSPKIDKTKPDSYFIPVNEV